jgi:aldose 1-epimerase
VSVVAPPGRHYRLSHGDQVAVISDVGAALRSYRVGARDVVLAFDEAEIAISYSGSTLAPWPNRIADGRYTWDGVTHQLDINESGRRTALHGLVAMAPFEAVAHGTDSVTLSHSIVPSAGYPWPVEVTVNYQLTDAGIEVTTRAVNIGSTDAPYGLGAHPWLSPGQGTVDECTFQLDAATHVDVDPERLLPTGTTPVEGRFDLRKPTSLQGTAFDDAWVDVLRGDDGLARVRLTGSDGRTVEMWADGAFTAWQVCTGDGIEGIDRGGVVVEPMTCVADAFRTGERVVRLAPGASHQATWGVRLI